ncbi:MAG TPA: hypothetical protein ENJ00_04755 [Phycisphaerales bacterium]|nr:hypothetical protein [Phycisphaerales bacterium]
MSTLVGISLIIIAAFNFGLILIPYLMGKGELMTIKNVFLVGFTIYQVTSGAISIFDPYSYTSELYLTNPDSTTATYLAYVIIFEFVFLIMYRWGIGAKKFAHITPVIRGEPRESILWLFAFLLIFVALVLRITVRVPYVAVLTNHVGTSTAAVAAGLGAWIWVRRPFNPVAMSMMVGILLLSIFVAIIGVFGRRPIVAVVGCTVWATYYSRWRFLPPRQVLVRALIFGIIPVIIVAKYTTVRGQFYGSDMGSFQRMKIIASASTKTGLVDLASGQECAAWSMWLIETHPDILPYNHLHAIKYYFQLPIPRTIYHDKPTALAVTAWRDAGVSGKPPGYTIGPGILGHAGAEGGFYALILYAAVTGLFVRYFDSILAKAPKQPFVSLPIGASLGNMLGMPRGESPNFAFEFTVGVMGTFVMLFIIAWFLKLIGYISSDDLNNTDELDDQSDADPYDEYAGYGE